MNISASIGIPFLFALLLVAVTFIISFVKSSNWYLRLNLHSVLDKFIEGSILSTFLIVFEVIFKQIDSSTILPVMYAGLIVIALTGDTIMAMFYIPFNLIYSTLTTPYSPTIFAPIAIAFVVILINEFLVSFNVSYRSLILTIIILLSSLIAYFTLSLGTKYSNNLVFSNSLFFILLTIIPLLSIIWVNRIAVSANVLNDRIFFHFGEYYRSGYWKTAVFDMISENKITYGTLMLFKINFSKAEPVDKKEVKRTILSNIEKETSVMDRKLLHFEADIYGIFIPSSKRLKISSLTSNNYKKYRSINDDLKPLEDILISNSKIYLTSSEKHISASISGGASAYGQQSSSLINLERDALFALRSNVPSISKITFFDYRLYRTRLNENIEITAMDSILGLEDYENVFLPIIKDSRVVWNYVLTKNINGVINEKTYDYVRSLNKEDIFKRYFSTDALRKINSGKIKMILPFTIQTINSTLNINEFKRVLEKNIVSISDIAISLWIKENDSSKDVIAAANTLNKAGIKVVIDGKISIVKSELEQINPLFVIAWNKENVIKTDKLVRVSTALSEGTILLTNNKQNFSPIDTWTKVSI